MESWVEEEHFQRAGCATGVLPASARRVAAVKLRFGFSSPQNRAESQPKAVLLVPELSS